MFHARFGLKIRNGWLCTVYFPSSTTINLQNELIALVGGSLTNKGTNGTEQGEACATVVLLHLLCGKIKIHPQLQISDPLRFLKVC
jgi:hypothetical protein